jgi:hypothetical protein
LVLDLDVVLFLFSVTDLRLENSGIDELDKLLINTLFEVVFYSDLINTCYNNIVLCLNLTIGIMHICFRL